MDAFTSGHPFPRPSSERGSFCMEVDRERIAEAGDWLARALADLQSAAILIDASPPHPDTSVFHAQQAAEKAWKAFLFWHDVPFKKTHDLRELGRACTHLDKTGRGDSCSSRGSDAVCLGLSLSGESTTSFRRRSKGRAGCGAHGVRRRPRSAPGSNSSVGRSSNDPLCAPQGPMHRGAAARPLHTLPFGSVPSVRLIYIARTGLRRAPVVGALPLIRRAFSVRCTMTGPWLPSAGALRRCRTRSRAPRSFRS